MSDSLGKTRQTLRQKDNPGNHNSFRGIFSSPMLLRKGAPASKGQPEDNKKEDIQRHPLVLKLSAIIC